MLGDVDHNLCSCLEKQIKRGREIFVLFLFSECHVGY
jgi:hypothetical protein